MPNQNNKPAKPVRSSLSKPLRSEKPGALIKHLQQVSTKQVVETRWQRQNFEQHLVVLGRKIKEYQDSDLQDKDIICQGLRVERGKVIQDLENLPAYYTLREIKVFDEDGLIQDIMELLLWLDEQLSLNNKMSTAQITNCAYMVAEEFAGICLEEVGIALKQGLNGHFGEIYRLDTNVILNWLRKYRKEKAELIREMNESQHASTKPDSQEERNSRKAEPEKIDPTEFFSNK